MMRKRVLAALLAMVLVFCLTGCMEMHVEEKISKSGAYRSTSVVYLDKEAAVEIVEKEGGEGYVDSLDEIMQEGGFTVQTIDGKDYYVSKPEVSKSTIVKETKNSQQDTVKGSYQIWETGISIDMKAMLGDMTDSLSTDLLSTTTDVADAKRILANSYLVYTVVFDYDIIKTDKNGTIDSTDPKKASWKISLDPDESISKIEAYCKSDIKVSGVTQGATYKKAKKVKFQGAVSATYKGKKVKSGTSFKKHGQHTLILKAASGEQRTVTFFIDKKKPVVKGVKNKKTYTKKKNITIQDKDSGIASIKINGKKQDVSQISFTIKKKGTNTIVVKDKVGNTTKIKVTIKAKKKSKKKKK